MPYLLRREDALTVMHGPIAQANTKEDFSDPYKKRLDTEFFRPIKYGQPLTEAMRAMAPDPYEVGGDGPTGKNRDLPDIFGGSLGPWHVSERVKTIIEDLEPRHHNFIPINVLKYGSKKHVPYQYYILHTSFVNDAVVFEETDFGQGPKGEAQRKNPTATISLLGKCTLDVSKINGSHFWRGGIGKIPGGGDALWHQYFASDELVKRLKFIRARGWRYQKCQLT
jgi:hypothetical protein